VATANGGTAMASINSDSLRGSSPPGISVNDAAAALDVIAQSLQLV
jgi:hypothetical protein